MLKSLKMTFYWPETSSFCGIFSLKCGVYFYVVLNFFTNGGLTYATWFIYSLHLKHTNGEIRNDTPVEILSEAESAWSTVVKAFLIIFLSYKGIETIFAGILLYGVLKTKRILVKLHLYFSIGTWLLSLLINIIIAFFLDFIGRFFIAAIILLHGYMLLNIRSYYLQIIGKLRVEANPTPDSDSVDANTIELLVNQVDVQNTNVPHCSTCNCMHTSVSGNEISRYQRLESNTSTSPNPSYNDDKLHSQQGDESSNDGDKPMNFKDAPIIYDERQLEFARNGTRSQNSDLFEHTRNDERCDKTSNHKIDEKDIPVIYDENQLNVGSSPILEDRLDSRNFNDITDRQRYICMPSTSEN